MPMPLEELFEFIEPQDKNGGMIRSTEQKLMSHQVSIDEDIGVPAKYRDLINLLYMCNEGDQVNIFINSAGGMLSSAMAIIEGIKGSASTVRAIITGECHSAASIIALHCHEIMVTDSAHMMIHTAQYSSGGNTHNVKVHTEFSTKHINAMIDSTYEGFLSPDEIFEIKKGVEMWFDAGDIKKRLASRLRILNKKSKTALMKKS